MNPESENQKTNHWQPISMDPKKKSNWVNSIESPPMSNDDWGDLADDGGLGDSKHDEYFSLAFTREHIILCLICLISVCLLLLPRFSIKLLLVASQVCIVLTLDCILKRHYREY